MAMLPEPQNDHDERQEVIIHRSQLLTKSFELLAYAESEVLQGGISVEFITEEATGPGVLREWFSLICREIFNPQNALFLSCPNDHRRFFPNPGKLLLLFRHRSDCLYKGEIYGSYLLCTQNLYDGYQ
jgi:hypothetical protein